jgi:uncharacterized protein
LRIYFVTDLHGSDLCYRKFLNAAAFYEADVLVLGGDICGKYLIPYWANGDGYVMRSDDRTEHLAESALAAALQKQRDRGGYPYKTTPDELAELELDGDALDRLFARLSAESVERWLALAAERLERTKVRCFISPGNDDPPEIDALLDASAVTENPEGRVVELGGGITMISCGVANPTPWNSPREAPEDELYSGLARLADGVPDPDRCIFNVHVPPHDTPLDVAPLLDETLKPVVRAGEVVAAHVGSTAVRRIIEERRPLLGLHGHIHESRAACRLNGSLCLNPGSEYHQGTLLGGLVQIRERRPRIDSYQLTQG